MNKFGLIVSILGVAVAAHAAERKAVDRLPQDLTDLIVAKVRATPPQAACIEAGCFASIPLAPEDSARVGLVAAWRTKMMKMPDLSKDPTEIGIEHEAMPVVLWIDMTGKIVRIEVHGRFDLNHLPLSRQLARPEIQKGIADDIAFWRQRLAQP